MTTKLLVIDGHSMAFRAFFALPADRFTTSGGQHTNAVYGFLSMLTKLLDTEKPTHLAVAFDAARESFRTEMFPEYKANRDTSPPEFAGQIALIKELLETMGVKQTEVVNYEADDIIATLATKAREDGFEVLIASGDRDTFQLIDEKTTVIYPGRSTSDLVYMTPEKVVERYGVPPAQYPEIAALVGETSDNLPGVPGWGAKTAAQWLVRMGGLDLLLENAQKVTGKRGEALRENLEAVRTNRKLNHLLTDMTLDLQPEECLVEAPRRLQVQALFDDLEISGLRDRVFKAMAPLWGEDILEQDTTGDETAGQRDQQVIAVDPGADLPALLGGFLNGDGTQQLVALWGAGRLGVNEPDLVGLALAGETQTLVVDPAELTEAQHAELAQFLSAHTNTVAHGAKDLMHAVASAEWAMPVPAFDTKLAAYLARPGQRSYNLDVVLRQVLGRDIADSGDGALLSLDEVGGGEAGGLSPAQESLAQNAASILDLVDPLRQRLTVDQELTLLTDLELPVAGVLEQMEATGIAIDVAKLKGLRDEFAAEAAQAAEDAYAAIGHETHLGSPKQLQVVLFEELGMPKTRKTKTGYTTDAEALLDLHEKTGHPFLGALLAHRDKTKLIQMIDGLLSEVAPDGRIHTTFHQTASATGRLASSDPNLQNIPVRSDAGVRIREAFVAGPGFEDLMSVDYSQIEMRIMAHLSKDQDLIAAFNSGEDLHATMAASIFGVPLDEVTGELRNRIKATSYGLAYGLSPYGLSKQLGISVDEARDLHDQYFVRFGGIGDYLARVVEEAARTGYTETMLGRRRYFPELNSDVRRVREMAGRAALNAPIQGSAADIIKLAMVEVAKQLSEGHYASRILLQVHDELVLEIAPGEASEVEELVRRAMAAPVSLSVPLDVAVGIGRSWRDAAH